MWKKLFEKRLRILENKTQIEFVAEFDSGVAMAKHACETRPIYTRDWMGRRIEGVAYFVKGKAPKCTYIQDSNCGGEPRFFLKRSDIEVDREGNPIPQVNHSGAPGSDGKLEMYVPSPGTMTEKPKRKYTTRKMVIRRSKNPATVELAKEIASSLEVGQIREVLKSDWKGKTQPRSRLNYYGREDGRTFSVKNRGSHYLITRTR